jgi:hypothetical protein
MTGVSEFTTLPGSMIYEPPTLTRPVNHRIVQQLAESIKERGLMHPITVTPKKRTERGVLKDRYEIVAGVHRFKAMFQILNYKEIPVQIVEMDAEGTELLTIDENLMRAELTVAQAALLTKRRKKIYEDRNPETKLKTYKGNQHSGGRNNCDNLNNPNRPQRFTKDTAEKTNKSERSVQESAELGEKICDEAFTELMGTALDSRRYLKRLKDIPKEDQVQRVKYDLMHLNEVPEANKGRKPKQIKPEAATPDNVVPIVLGPAPVPAPVQSVSSLSEEEQIEAVLEAFLFFSETAQHKFLNRIGATIAHPMLNQLRA